MELGDKEIERYSKLFKVPISVVETTSLIYEERWEVEKALYELGEEPDDIDFTDVEEPETCGSEEQDAKSSLENFIFDILENKLKSTFTDIPRNTVHICPFSDSQRKQIKCDKCILHTPNLIMTARHFQKQLKIDSIEEAVEKIKFDIYSNRDYFFKQMLEDDTDEID